MEVVARRYQDSLDRIKTTVKRSHDYFKPNYDRYNEFRRFVFECSLKNEEITLLMTLSRPQLEFNVLEAYISRLLGEFSKQEPDICISPDDQNQTDPMLLKVLEQHLRHTLSDAENYHVKYEVYRDLLSGGFSTLKISTDYANAKSFNQVINVRRAYDPTLCGWDQTAVQSHKGDGRFCFELSPMARDEFEEEYPNVPLRDMNFRRDFAGFNWSYVNDSTPSLLLCDYYEKKDKKTRIFKLTDGRVMTQKEYDEMLSKWGEFYAPPVPQGKGRMTNMETIVRYRLIENQILEYVETDFAHFPLIFVDGNSILVKTPKNGNIRQVTRPYVYHAKGSQRLKNFAGIALANEIENVVQHKFIIKKEALPKEEEWLSAIKNIQKPSNVVVNAFYEENPDQPIPDPIREVTKIPAPPEITNAFSSVDQTIQGILGSYDASLGINNNQLSGIAIVEAATQSNAAAMPYIVNFMQGLQRAAQIYIDLLPKYYKTPRTIPVVDEEGKRSYVKINSQDGFNMFYDANSLNVEVKAGASFQVQKSRTIMMIKEMMGMSPLFQQFIAEKGLNFVLDNMEGKGIEQLKSMVDQFVQEMEKQKQMAMQQQQQEMQNNPAVMKAQTDQARLQHDVDKSEKQFMMDMEKLKSGERKILADLEQTKQTNLVQVLKANTERFSKQVDLQLKTVDFAHKHARDVAAHHHKVREAKANESKMERSA